MGTRGKETQVRRKGPKSRLVGSGDCSGDIPIAGALYRTDRDEWRAVYPAATLLQIQHADMWSDYKWTIESSVECWVTAARRLTFERPMKI